MAERYDRYHTEREVVNPRERGRSPGYGQREREEERRDRDRRDREEGRRRDRYHRRRHEDDDDFDDVRDRQRYLDSEDVTPSRRREDDARRKRHDDVDDVRGRRRHDDITKDRRHINDDDDDRRRKDKDDIRERRRHDDFHDVRSKRHAEEDDHRRRQHDKDDDVRPRRRNDDDVRDTRRHVYDEDIKDRRRQDYDDVRHDHDDVRDTRRQRHVDDDPSGAGRYEKNDKRGRNDRYRKEGQAKKRHTGYYDAGEGDLESDYNADNEEEGYYSRRGRWDREVEPVRGTRREPKRKLEAEIEEDSYRGRDRSRNERDGARGDDTRGEPKHQRQEMGSETATDYDGIGHTDKNDKERSKLAPYSAGGVSEVDLLPVDYRSDTSGRDFNVAGTSSRRDDDKRGDQNRTREYHNSSGDPNKQKKLRRDNNDELRHIRASTGATDGGYENGAFELKERERGRDPTGSESMGNKNSVEPFDASSDGDVSRPRSAGTATRSTPGSAAWALDHQISRNGRRSAPSDGDNISTIYIDAASGTNAFNGVDRADDAERPRTALARKRLTRAGPLTEDEEFLAVLGDAKAAARMRDHQRAELEGRRQARGKKIAEGSETNKGDISRTYGDLYRKTLQAQLVTSQKEKATGWKKFKLRRSQEWKKAQRRWREILANLEVWRGSFKAIEGNFGTSVTSYFRFLKWLLGLNIFITVLLLGVVVLTQVFMDPQDFEDSLQNVSRTRYTEKAQRCTVVYETFVGETINNHSAFDQVLDFFSGTGFMEHTSLFYGYYFNKTYLWVDDTQQNYNMPIAYIMAAAFYFLVSLALMVTYTARGLKESQLTSGEKFYHTCNKVFCTWDYSLTQEKAAKYKQKNIHDDIKHDLEEQYRKQKQDNRTTGEKIKLYVLRLIVNVFVVAVLAGACYLIYWTSIKTLELAEDQNNSGIVALLIQFLPSIAITMLNVIVPLLFERVVVVEDYSTEFEIKLTIARTVILRLASIAVLVFTLGLQLLDCDVDRQFDCGSCINNVFCWETYVGQQFYKLVVLDFFVIIGVTFLVQYPRKFIVNRYETKYKLVRVVGHQEFEIPKNVLDLVYTQTLCWLGAFYSPLIPPITVMKMFFFFYAKKISLLHTCVPSRKSFRASNIQSFFMTILMLSIVLCIVPIVYTITKVSPSQSCGAFRIHDRDEFRMYQVVGHAVATLPDVLREIMYFLGTWTFYVPLYIVLALFIYYYIAVAAGNRKMVQLLKDQLALEGKDKQFLLGQVRDALQRGDLNSY